MKHTPFNIYSIAYDISDKLIRVSEGMKAIKERVVRVNDLEMAKETAKIYNRPLEELIKRKAVQLDFSYELPNV